MKSESKIQQEIFVWFWNSYCLPKHGPREVIFHVPNEGQHRLVNIGVLAGVSDLVFSFKGKTYYCEVKDEKGKQAPSQIKFEQHISQVQGSEYFLVRSLSDFKGYINDLLHKNNRG